MEQENTILRAANAERTLLMEAIREVDAEMDALKAKRNMIMFRLHAVTTLLSAYTGSPPTGAAEIVLPPLQGSMKHTREFLTEAGERTQSLKSQALAAAASVLSEVPRLRTADLLKEIEKRGVVFTATNKTAHLSVMLSNDGRFEADRRNGWALKPQGESTSAT